MADLRVRRADDGHTRIRNVPIAVTPEGFWCCPSPAAYQKTLRSQLEQNRQKSAPPTPQHAQPSKPPVQRKLTNNSLRSRINSEDPRSSVGDVSALCQSTAAESTTASMDCAPRRISVGFGQLEASDLKVIVSGKDMHSVRLSVHKNVLVEQSSFFAEKIRGQSSVNCIEIGDCEDVEIYVETVGLMYCKEIRQRLIKQTVSRVLRILKTAESLGFHACIKLCLEYLEAVPWVGEDEEHVVSSVRQLQSNMFGANKILKRVSSDIHIPPNDTLAHIIDLVLKSNDDKGRQEMKSMVLKLLKENSLLTCGSLDKYAGILYTSCQSCLGSLLILFKHAASPRFCDNCSESKDSVFRQIALAADNLLWLVDIMADRQVADEFTSIWAAQDELATLHSKIPIVSRHLVSCITARLFIGIGRGEILPFKETRQMLLQVWLQPLVDDYCWLQHACRSFDQKVVEEAIGRTILTLPLEDQQTILLAWLGSFLKIGDRCPNLQRAFEVWWRRTFIRPYIDHRGGELHSDK